MLTIVAIIPCRYASTRLPGKPLRKIAGKTLIHHIYENVLNTQLFEQVIVATDDERIVKEVESFNGEVVMSDKGHPSGSDRVAEIARSLDADVVVNIQGDELFLGKNELSELLKCFQENSTSVATLAHPLCGEAEIFNPNRVKVVCDRQGNALYFSRSVIPYLRGNEKFNTLGHIGVYAFRKNALINFAECPQSKLEKAERLEQLRLLENGIRIRVVVTDYEGFGIDTEADLAEAEKLLLNI
ncbi:MAG: 3-deoxy-manno-octulosonate cytidylyltransferase [Candidatus Celaenobacter antarcticus]|nr:3-deoxy-manno-octulosonate cytidylyltransferase [Candidatus Celaenobacter antarcticus]